MLVRYKKAQTEAHASEFNVHALDEVLTGDDSAPISELDVFITALNQWKDMRQAFNDRDIIPNNHNTRFGEPKTQLYRARGYSD
jgi:hypothetical protein